MLTIAMAMAVLATLGAKAASAQDEYALKAPGGPEFSEFRDYENGQVDSASLDGDLRTAGSRATRM